MRVDGGDTLDRVFRRVLATGFVTACGLFPDLSGLEGNGSDGSTADTGSLDVQNVDVAQDVAAPDVTVDAGDWCASQEAGYRLCADFDDSLTAAQGFDLEAKQGVGGQFSLNTATFVSAPESALGVANPFDAGQTSGDRLEKSLWLLGPTPSTFECTLQWNPAALSTTPNDYAHVLELALWSDAAGTQSIVTYSLNMQVNGQLVMLEYYASMTSASATHLVTTSVAPKWTNVVISISATAQTYSVTVGNMNAAGNLSKPIPSTSHGVVEIGPAYFGGDTDASSPGWTFGYDNVLCY
jgi:hypothetical protein